MDIDQRKTLEDFPKFFATALHRGETTESGYTLFEVEGTFDRIIEHIDEFWFWLLFGERDYITPKLKSFDKETKRAVLTCYERDEPMIVGQSLAHLSPYWQAFHVWMVLDPTWGWDRKQFQGTDAVAEDYESKDLPMVGGRAVRVWTKLEPTGVGRGQSRHYPATDQTLPVRVGTRLVPSGWGHEHCELCNAHIDVGAFGFSDADDRWLCEKCYERYVKRHDLAFVDEL